jgi:hypothetical protein
MPRPRPSTIHRPASTAPQCQPRIITAITDSFPSPAQALVQIHPSLSSSTPLPRSVCSEKLSSSTNFSSTIAARASGPPLRQFRPPT